MLLHCITKTSTRTYQIIWDIIINDSVSQEAIVCLPIIDKQRRACHVTQYIFLTHFIRGTIVLGVMNSVNFKEFHPCLQNKSFTDYRAKYRHRYIHCQSDMIDTINTN